MTRPGSSTKLRSVARVLRVDDDAWRWRESDGSWWGAWLIVLGTYLLFAFSRFGWPDFAIRPTARYLLVGVYGWLWLAAGSWALIWLGIGRRNWKPLLRLCGHAHLPLLALAFVVRVFGVAFDLAHVGRWSAGFVATIWLPAMLVRAVAAASEITARQAVVMVALPYLVWVAAVGRYFVDQLRHVL